MTTVTSSATQTEPTFKASMQIVAQLTQSPLSKKNGKQYHIFSAVPTDGNQLAALVASGKDTISVNFTMGTTRSLPVPGERFEGWGMVVPSTTGTGMVTFVEVMGAPLALNGDLTSIFG